MRLSHGAKGNLRPFFTSADELHGGFAHKPPGFDALWPTVLSAYLVCRCGGQGPAGKRPVSPRHERLRSAQPPVPSAVGEYAMNPGVWGGAPDRALWAVIRNEGWRGESEEGPCF